MKKFLALVTVLLMLATSFAACNQSEIPKNTTETNINGQIDRALLTIETLEEYDAFLETMPNVEGFVTYDMVKEIGPFTLFVCMSYPSVNDYSYYKYKFTDETGTRFSLYIKHVDTISAETPKVIETVDIQNMRQADTKEDGTCTHKGLTYKYYDGKLNSISWYSGGREFTIAGTSIVLADYPVTREDTFISKLLNQETAVAAVESINAKVAMK